MSPYGCVDPCYATIKLSTIYNNDNYQNNEDARWSIFVRGAQALKLHFASIDVEQNFDFVKVFDKKGNLGPSWTGTLTNVETPWLNGGRAEVRLTSDGSITRTGFEVDRVYVRWGWGSIYSGYGPKDENGWRGNFVVEGDMRVDNDVRTFLEMDATLSSGKRIKQAAWSPELPPEWCPDPYDCFEPRTVGYEFKIRVGDGAGPIRVNDVQIDESQPMPPSPPWTANFELSIGMGVSYYGLQAGMFVVFSPAPSPAPPPTKEFSMDGHEARVYIPVDDQGHTQDRAVGVVWKLTATSGTEGFYEFRTLTRIDYKIIWWYCSPEGTPCVPTDTYYHQLSSSGWEYSATSGESTGWVNGVLDFGNSASRFQNREYRISDLTMSGWRANVGPNGWQEMNARQSYFLTNEAGCDAVSWLRLVGNLASAHTVTFRYERATGSTWELKGEDSWTTLANPPNGYYQPSGTYWFNCGSPATGSYKVHIKVDGVLVARPSFELAAP